MKTSRLFSQRGLSTVGYLGLIAVFATATFGVLLLYQNIVARKAEATKDVFRVVEGDDRTVDPAVWG